MCFKNEFIRNRSDVVHIDIMKVKGILKRFYSFILMTSRIRDVNRLDIIKGRWYDCAIEIFDWGGRKTRDYSPSVRAREIDPSSGMLSFRLWLFMKEMAESLSMVISFIALLAVSLGSSFISSTSDFSKSLLLRSTVISLFKDKKEKTTIYKDKKIL